jgi:lysophospholipase L1-like esterase
LLSSMVACAPESQPAGEAFTYAAIGASDTAGTGADDPEREAWVALIFDRLPPGSRFVRLGVSGHLAGEALAYQVPRAEAARPDLVTVWLGVNDLNAGVPLERYAAGLDEILRRLTATGARVFVGNLPDLTKLPAYGDLSPVLLLAEVEQWNRAMADVAGRRGAVLVDLMGPSQQLGERAWLIAEDGFHPSSDGHRALGDVFWEAISRDPLIGPVLRGG